MTTQPTKKNQDNFVWISLQLNYYSVPTKKRSGATRKINNFLEKNGYLFNSPYGKIARVTNGMDNVEKQINLLKENLTHGLTAKICLIPDGVETRIVVSKRGAA